MAELSVVASLKGRQLTVTLNSACASIDEQRTDCSLALIQSLTRPKYLPISHSRGVLRAQSSTLHCLHYETAKSRYSELLDVHLEWLVSRLSSRFRRRCSSSRRSFVSLYDAPGATERISRYWQLPFWHLAPVYSGQLPTTSLQPCRRRSEMRFVFM